MAYVDSDLLKQDENQQSQAGGPTISGSSASEATSGAPNGAPAGQKSKTPSNFANLDNYLNVNQGQNFGQQLAGKIGDEVNQGSQVVDNAEKQFKERVDSNTVKDSNNLTGQIATNPQGIDANAFSKIRDASYQGPNTLADTQDLASQIQGSAGTATAKAQASATEPGRFALLNSYFGKPTYSQGQKTLDNLLVQNDPNSQQAFDQIRQNAADLKSKTQALDPALQQYAGQGAQQTKDTRSAARGALGIDDSGNLASSGAIPGLQLQIQSETKAAQDRAAKEYQDAQSLASQNQYGLSPEFLKAMGVGGDKGYGVNAGDYLTQNNINQNQVVTADEASRLRALESLGGQSDFLSGADESKFGTAANTKGYSFDTDRYGKNVATQKAAYNQEREQATADKAAAEKNYQTILNGAYFGDYNSKENAAARNNALQQVKDAQSKIDNVDHHYLGTMRSLPSLPSIGRTVKG